MNTNNQNEYYYEENYPDCIGDKFEYGKQLGCLTCIYKGECIKEINNQSLMTQWESQYDY